MAAVGAKVGGRSRFNLLAACGAQSLKKLSMSKIPPFMYLASPPTASFRPSNLFISALSWSWMAVSLAIAGNLDPHLEFDLLLARVLPDPINKTSDGHLFRRRLARGGSKGSSCRVPGCRSARHRVPDSSPACVSGLGVPDGASPGGRPGLSDSVYVDAADLSPKSRPVPAYGRDSQSQSRPVPPQTAQSPVQTETDCGLAGR